MSRGPTPKVAALWAAVVGAGSTIGCGGRISSTAVSSVGVDAGSDATTQPAASTLPPATAGDDAPVDDADAASTLVDDVPTAVDEVSPEAGPEEAAPEEAGPNAEEGGVEATADAGCPTMSEAGTCLAALTIAASEYNTCALLSNRSVYCWGDNEFGSLGNGTITLGSSSPVAVEIMADVTALAGGGSHTCALRSDGTVWCWGNYGEAPWLPDGGADDTATPQPILGIGGALAIAAGTSQACALLPDTTVRCWGHNFDGQLGDGTTNDSDVGVQVAGLSGVKSIAAGADYSCAALLDGSVRCWGNNDEGQLGDGTGVSSPTWVQVSGLTTVATLAAGWDHTCAQLADGSVQCWGSNTFAQLSGTTTGPDTCFQALPCSKVPVPVQGFAGATAVSAGQGFTCALQGGGNVQCWGMNIDGQLGDGTSTGPQSCDGDACSTLPVAVDTLNDATAITCGGGSHCCALLSDGSIQCWGSNSSGELGEGASSGPSTCAGDSCSTVPVPVQW
jgi:alpha-tubulin suppressor-like RCC1 family protein